MKKHVDNNNSDTAAAATTTVNNKDSDQQSPTGTTHDTSHTNSSKTTTTTEKEYPHNIITSPTTEPSWEEEDDDDDDDELSDNSDGYDDDDDDDDYYNDDRIKEAKINHSKRYKEVMTKMLNMNIHSNYDDDDDGEDDDDDDDNDNASVEGLPSMSSSPTSSYNNSDSESDVNVSDVDVDDDDDSDSDSDSESNSNGNSDSDSDSDSDDDSDSCDGENTVNILEPGTGTFMEPQNYSNVVIRTQEFNKDATNSNSNRTLKIERTSLSQPQLPSSQNHRNDANTATSATPGIAISVTTKGNNNINSSQQAQKQHQSAAQIHAQQSNQTEKWNINSKSYKQHSTFYPKQHSNQQCTCKQTSPQHQCTCKQYSAGQQAPLAHQQTVFGQQQQQQQSSQHAGSQKGKSQRGAHHSSSNSSSQKSGNARSGSKKGNKSHSTTNFHAQTKSSSSIHEGNSNPGNYLGQSLYKTELCKSFSEFGTCKYGPKCQFAHGIDELRYVEKHPRYKTAICRSYRKFGTCKYGNRCCFLHIGPGEEVPPKVLTSTSSLTNLPTTATTPVNTATVTNASASASTTSIAGAAHNGGGGIQLSESTMGLNNSTGNMNGARIRYGAGSATSSPYNPGKVKSRGAARTVGYTGGVTGGNGMGSSVGGLGNSAGFGDFHGPFSLNSSFGNIENGTSKLMGPAGRDLWKDSSQGFGWSGRSQCGSLGNSLGSFSGLGISTSTLGAGHNNTTGSASVATCTSLNNSLTSFNFTDCSTSTLPLGLGGVGNSAGSRIDGDDYNIATASASAIGNPIAGNDILTGESDMMSYAIGTVPIVTQQPLPSSTLPLHQSQGGPKSTSSSALSSPQHRQMTPKSHQSPTHQTASFIRTGAQNYESMSSATATNGSEIINENSANSSPTTSLRDIHSFIGTTGAGTIGGGIPSLSSGGIMNVNNAANTSNNSNTIGNGIGGGGGGMGIGGGNQNFLFLPGPFLQQGTPGQPAVQIPHKGRFGYGASLESASASASSYNTCSSASSISSSSSSFHVCGNNNNNGGANGPRLGPLSLGGVGGLMGGNGWGRGKAGNEDIAGILTCESLLMDDDIGDVINGNDNGDDDGGDDDNNGILLGGNSFGINGGGGGGLWGVSGNGNDNGIGSFGGCDWSNGNKF